MENNFYIENEVYIIVPENSYDIAILVGGGGIESINPTDDNVDVEIRFKDGRTYTGSFFTLQNIKSLFVKNKNTGECHSGLYFYCKDMIIVEVLTVENIISTIQNLFEEDLLESVFDLHNPTED